MEIILHRLNEGGTFENEFLVLTIQKLVNYFMTKHAHNFMYFFVYLLIF